MSIVLPKELQTRKVKSLPDKDRKLVEELLAEKFDIREEVVPKRDDHFRQEYIPDPRQRELLELSENDAFVEYTDARYGQSGVQLGFNAYTRSRVARSKITRRGNAESGILKAQLTLDINNIPSGVRRLYIHLDRLQFLRNDPRISIGMNANSRITEYHGCEMIVIPSHQEEYIQAEF